ncbi:MAG: FAD-dependent 5-carboxymethylaminomethyl-2-thiouridine(34) oxidoreductase MnmC [Deefgea sp.]
MLVDTQLNGASLGKTLANRWKGQDHFSILVSKFAQGDDFLNTWQAWRQDSERSQRLHYIAFISSDFSMPQFDAIAGDAKESSEIYQLVLELQSKWPQPIRGFHRIYLDQNAVMLTLVFGEFSARLNEVSGPIHAFILNHASPVLELTVLKQIWRLCQADSTIETHFSDSLSQDNLKKTGFSFQLEATHSSSLISARCIRAPKTNDITPPSKEAIIIGAGIAGCATAASLAQRGWQILLVDAQLHIASQASGNHVGLCHPTFSLDDNFQARLSRAGFFTTQQKLNDLLNSDQPVHFAANGHFQIAKDCAAAELMQAILKQQQVPSTLVSWVNAEQAQQHYKIRCEFGGWWFPQGMWINPASACNAYINRSINKISLQLNTHVNEIKYSESQWHLFNSDGDLIASTATLILANAHDATRLLPTTELALSSSLRSVTRLPAQNINTSQFGVSGLTYLTAEFDGWRCAGASLVDPSLSDAEIEESNLRDLSNLIGSEALQSSSGAQTRQCTRPNSADRLPLVGQLPNTNPIRHSVHQLFHIPRVTGLYAVLGFGSRGLSWHALAAEVLACQLCNEPQGIERSLIDAIDPARFALRRLRKLTSHCQPEKY